MRALPWLLLVAPLSMVPSAMIYLDTRCVDCAFFVAHRHAGADTAPIGILPFGSPGPGQVLRDDYVVHGPKAGYWYRALRHADENPAAPDPHRFAACAYPADYPRSGRKTYLIDENATVFERDLGRPGPPDVFPDLETLKRDWSKPD